ncbi:hypothetical protein PtA15_4A658 [Puccinia triticina]|uniref:Uncharacterized protein n=1 Tax=Puccinia triticina TaxID=208348 RepID=A0ABY7CJA5_9BASI|nr:uncharacterized protein PtA15_4A658 [Puccinia triticina]WAQ84206.1 hypothetical protein PtA15_4A658 [Puccinia triticina]
MSNPIPSRNKYHLDILSPLALSQCWPTKLPLSKRMTRPPLPLSTATYVEYTPNTKGDNGTLGTVITNPLNIHRTYSSVLDQETDDLLLRNGSCTMEKEQGEQKSGGEEAVLHF